LAVFGRTWARLFKTRSTVATLTPEACATCSMVGRFAKRSTPVRRPDRNDRFSIKAIEDLSHGSY
jgi:hypothetical protein